MNKSLQSLSQHWGNYRRVLQLVWGASPRYAFLATFFATLSALATPAQIWLSKVIIDRIISAIQNRAPGAAIDWTALVLPMGVLLLVLLYAEVGRRVAESITLVLRFQVEHYVQHLLLKKAAQFDIAFFESATFYDKLDLARSESYRTFNLALLATDSLGLLLSLLLTLSLVTQFHPLAAAVMVLLAIPQLIVSSQYAKELFALLNRQTPDRRMVDYLAEMLVGRDAIKEIRLFGLQQPFLERFQRFWQNYFTETAGIVFKQERQNVLLLILSALGTGAIWLYAIVQAVLARITIGELTLIIQAVERVRTDLGELFKRGGIFYENSLFVSSLFQFLDLQPNAVEGALVRAQPRTQQSPPPIPAPLTQGIEFRNVSFHYPGAERLVLQNVSFTLQPGSSVALVGDNGAGKTTLVKLLARFYDPTEGAILLDGRDLSDYDVAALQANIGVIFQDFVRYQVTAQENIGFGRVEEVDALTRIMAAADKGGAVPVIEKLPNGYQTMLGKTFENSVDLSGGEWQKLALSRAFMRDAQILILDEPTAALDAKAEYDVYLRFAELTGGKTTLFISHRFSTVRMAQHILVLADGRLIEEGTHDQLMALGGSYAEMFTIQADRYR